MYYLKLCCHFIHADPESLPGIFFLPISREWCEVCVCGLLVYQVLKYGSFYGFAQKVCALAVKTTQMVMETENLLYVQTILYCMCTTTPRHVERHNPWGTPVCNLYCSSQIKSLIFLI